MSPYLILPLKVVLDPLEGRGPVIAPPVMFLYSEIPSEGALRRAKKRTGEAPRSPPLPGLCQLSSADMCNSTSRLARSPSGGVSHA